MTLCRYHKHISAIKSGCTSIVIVLADRHCSHRFRDNERRDSRYGGDNDRRRLLVALLDALGQIDDHRLVFGRRQFELVNAGAQTRILLDLKYLKQD